MPRPLGMTSLQILAAVGDGAAYGLSIVARTGLPSGTVYPTLARLRRAGLVSSRWEIQRVAESAGRPRRRYYELTPAGSDALARGRARLAAVASELGVIPAKEGG